MISENAKLIVELFEAIEADWALCDDRDEDKHLVLVNESRDEHQSLRPLKKIVLELEEKGYLKFDESKSDSKQKERVYMHILDQRTPIPFVYFYKVTEKGRELYEQLKHS